VFLLEYKLNKIEPETYRIVNDATREGKVHGSKDSSKVNRDKKEKQQQNTKSFKKELAKQTKKKKIFVDAVKIKKIDIDASKAETNLVQGRFLDTKR